MDIRYLLFLQNLRETTNSVFDSFFAFMTQFGEGTFSLLILAWIYWCISKKNGQMAFFSMNIADFLNGIFKMIACVYRPWIRDSRVIPVDGSKTTATGYSFPSGHSTRVSSYGFSLAYCYRRYKTIMISFILLVLLVMFSRNYLGVHTPQDVVFGMVTGLVVMVFSCTLMNWVREGDNRDLIVLGVAVAFVAIVLFFILHKSYPLDYVDGELIVDPVNMMPDSFKAAGYLLGMLLGWVCERRLIRFRIPKKVTSKVSRYLPGALIMLLLQFTLNTWLKNVLGPLWGGMLASAIVMFYILAVYPLIFKICERR